MRARKSSDTSRSSPGRRIIAHPRKSPGTFLSNCTLRLIRRRSPRKPPGHRTPNARSCAMNILTRAWSESGRTLGAWTTLNVPVVAESLALIGHDYVCLDQQHGVSDDSSLVAGLIAIAAGGATPLVRVPANEPSMISKALDCGAEGVIVPLVNDRRDAERAVQSCKYPPSGERSIGPVRTAGSGRGRTYGQAACIVMAESASAVDNIDEICSVPGVDAVYIG